MKHCFILLLIFLPLSILNSQVTINIPGDYPTIQEGINAASNGDRVLVAEGTYTENINFMGKAITVASQFINDEVTSHITSTIIDGSLPSNPDSGSVVVFRSGEDTNSVLCGFTITHGIGTSIASPGLKAGGGILIFHSGAKICNNIITSNTIDISAIYSWSQGGGILAISDNYNLIISNNVISENVVESSDIAIGGGISTYTGGPTRITSNKIINNIVSGQRGSGGGIDIWTPGNELYVTNNIIRGNQSLPNTSGGGGIDIYLSSSSVFIRNNLIAENIGYRGGGIFVDNNTEGDFRKTNSFNLNNHISDKDDRSQDKSLFSDKILLEAVIENNTIVDNTASIGGGIYCSNASPEIKNSIIWGNQPQPQIGGGGSVEYSDVEGGFSGTGNIDSEPLFADSEYYLLDPASPCIDAGNPDPQYNDVEDPFNPGTPMHPAFGTLRNDMGHCGGPNSLWCYWYWPVPVELTSFTAVLEPGIVKLGWTTATEKNNFGFEIERKISDFQSTGEWEKIGFVNGQGTTTKEQQYACQDDISNIYALALVYRLKQIDFNGRYEYSDEVFINNQVPVDYTLHQNYPNPFNPATTISYSLPVKSQVELVVYNTLGEKVMELVNEVNEAGKYSVRFNSSGLPSGVYLYKLQATVVLPGGKQVGGQAGNFVQVRKMMLLK